MVWGWIEKSFEERRAELHGWGTLDDGRIAVWVTLHGKHVGSGMPWLARPAPEWGPDRLASRFMSSPCEGDRLSEHWAVRDDLGVIEAIEGRSGD